MNKEQAKNIFDQTGDKRDYLINRIDAYIQELGNSKIPDKQYQHMKLALAGAKMIISDCFKDFNKSE